MNWLIWEKIFTYFCSKFRPGNRMHYIKCGVNSLLHNSGCCRRSVAPWITVLSRHSVLTIGVIYKFTLLWYSTKKWHHAQAHFTSGTLTRVATPLAMRRTDGSAVGYMISLVSVCYGDSQIAKHLLNSSQCQQPAFHWWYPQVWFFFWLMLRHLQQSALFTILCMTGHSCSNLTLLRYEHLVQWKQNGSKAMMWLLYKIPLFEDAQDIFSRMTAVCCRLLPHNPYRLPHYYKRHTCGPSCSYKHWFLSISFVWIVWVHATNSLSGWQSEFIS